MAAHNFEAALQLVLKHEGGYANHPSDPGGETMYGITKATARAHGYVGPMRSIPMYVVRDIYRKSYWDAVDGDILPVGLDYCVFDYAVNSGVSRAKRALASHGTINAICDERMRFLKGLRTWPTFGKGWTRRVSEVRSKANKMAGGGSISWGGTIAAGGAAAGAGAYSAGAGPIVFLLIAAGIAAAVYFLIIRRRK